MQRALEDRLRAYGRDLDDATESDASARLVAPGPVVPSPRRGAAVVTCGLLVAAAVVAAVLVSGRGTPTSRPGPAAPGSTAAPSDGFEQTLDAGEEAPSPLAPEGWQMLDVGDIRLQVPVSWTVPISASCTQPTEAALYVDDGTTTTCSPAAELPPEYIVFSRSSGPAPSSGTRGTFGTLEAVVAPQCSDCIPTYSFVNGWTVRMATGDQGPILATFTDSGAQKVLQRGRLASVEGWQPVRFGGVEMLVPDGWGRVDLPSSHFTTTDPSGNVNGGGGVADPGTCGGSLFGARPGTAYTGVSGMVVSCPVAAVRDLAPYDGLWLRADDGSRDAWEASPLGQVDGVEVQLLRPSADGPLPRSAPALELRISAPSGPVLVSLGVGPDVAESRTILSTMRLVG